MTLRANELRIGNIVNDPSGFGPMIVEAINPSPGRVYLRSMDGEYLGDFDINKIEAIPLTEEWLLKFGFYRNNNAWEDPKKFNTDFSVWNPVGSKVFEMNSDPIMTRIEFVHQLQNTYFAVTGIELPLANHPL